MKTRIKVIASPIKTEYWPQYKGLFGWYDMASTDSPLRYIRLMVRSPYTRGTLEYAQWMIDETLKDEELLKADKIHREKSKVSYVRYP